MPKLIMISLLNIAIGAAGLWWTGVRINITTSVPRGFYRSVDKPLERGDLVESCLPASAAELATRRGYLLNAGACGDHTPVLKRVLGLEGDVIAVRDHVVVNGREIASAPVLDADLGGRPLVPARGAVLDQDEVWLISDEIPNSFDSRYFGPVRMRDIRSVVRPLWTT